MNEPDAARSAPRSADGPFELPRAEFPRLLASLHAHGYAIVGPTVADGAIVYGRIRGEEDLPIGWTDVSEAGRYRIERRSDAALFGYNVGPHSWKKYLFPARERLWTARREGDGFVIDPEPDAAAPYAFLGVRACEIAAIEVQDRVFLGPHPDAGYRSRRERALVIAVACGQSARTCFCRSMGTGPAPSGGFDLALTEILSPGPHRFLVDVGSSRGSEVLRGVPLAPADGSSVDRAAELVAGAAAAQVRSMPRATVRETLLAHPEHPRWAEVANRCLACSNCTLACPTCFCHTPERAPPLDGDRVEQWRRWDSCFQLGFTELHHAATRTTVAARYRQWLTHKLATWHDQFGQSGCVGCGRCITWCPVGIDITEEVAAIGASPPPPSEEPR